jgi:UDPglucose--hexose-1-phosphate uridylyltransferase
MNNPFENRWEKRWHPLRQEWIVYSAHRNNRPWQGADLVKTTQVPAYDPNCYLCPGNTRIHGDVNPGYKQVYIFANDHPVVGMNAPDIAEAASDTLYKKEKASGVAKVVCYDPRHNMTLSHMPIDNVVKVFEAFRDETRALSRDPKITSVLIFENKGEAVGVSNPHPHCQIYATDFPFKLVAQQIEVSDLHTKKNGTNIFNDIIEKEKRDACRVISENDHAIAFIPFFARYAYEVMIFPKKRHQDLTSFDNDEVAGLAAVFHEVIRKLDMNFNMRFPYVMSVMQAPVDGKSYENFHTHLWIQPPYRQPGLIKYLAGPEIGAGNFMADTMPEDKAAELRKADSLKYNFDL